MPFEEIEQALRQRLEAFPPAARAELLHAFPPDFDRSDRIGSYYGNRRARLYGNRTRGRLLHGFLHSHDGGIATES